MGELVVDLGLIAKAAEVLPITAVQDLSPAQRPAYSLLDCTATRRQLHQQPQYWRAVSEDVICHVDA